MNSMLLKQRVETLLETKSSNYKKKYFVLSTLANSDARKNETIMSEIYSLCETLNNTNGELPTVDYLLEFHEKVLCYSNVKTKSINQKQENIKNYIDLTYKSNDIENMINEEINKIKSGLNKKVNKKLLEVLIESIEKNKNTLVPTKFVKLFGKSINESTIDLTKMFDDIKGPSREDLDQIESEDDFSLPEDDYQDGGQTLDKIAQMFASTGSKDPRKVSKKELASMLGYTGAGKYNPDSKTYKLSGWENLERDIVRRMDPYKNTGISVVAKRKWWLIKSIEACLMLEKQANKAFGTPEDVKSKFNVDDVDQLSAVQTVAKSRRGTGSSLSDAEGRAIMDQLHAELEKGSYDLENPAISEQRLLTLLSNAARYRGENAKQFAMDLDIMYPLSDQRADFEKVPMQSDEERQATQDEVEDYFRQKDEETKETYGDEIDPETGEPLYADEEQIRQINMQKKEQKKEIVKKEIIQNMSDANYLNMTAKEAKEYLRKLDEDLLRLAELFEKATDTLNPEIFSSIRTDSQGNILPDISAIPDVIPAEDLTDSEIKEIEDIIERMANVDFIKMINDCEREQIYQDLVDKSVTVDEFIAYNARFGLDDPEKPMTWEDIKRASAGDFTGSAGARQYGVKAWIKSVFFNFSPNDKADIYSYLAERWYERLKQLDLIDDQSFAIKQDKVNPNDPSLDKAIPKKALDAAEALGKYRRSDKLVDISNMLELVSKYTSPKYVKRYFDDKRDDNLPQAVAEKINQIQMFAETAEEYDTLIKRLEAEDPDTMAFAIMESMFNDKSGFRIFATGLLKEFYNNKIWPETEVALAQAVKQYFAKNYPSAGIAKSLGTDEGADAVRPEEGKDLFNKIIYVAMERTGIKTSGKGVPNVGDSVEERKDYLRGNLDSRGDFAKAVAAYNSKYQSGKNPLTGKYGSVYGKDDVEDLIDDVFNTSSGIIGKVSGQLKRLNTASAGEIITWIGDYPEGKLDQAIMLGMSLSDFYRREEANAILTLPIEKIGKDTAKAVSDYKKKYGKLLTSSDFTEWLDDFLGVEPIDPKAKGVKNPGGKSFQ